MGAAAESVRLESLERENGSLRQQLEGVIQENGELRSMLASYTSGASKGKENQDPVESANSFLETSCRWGPNRNLSRCVQRPYILDPPLRASALGKALRPSPPPAPQKAPEESGLGQPLHHQR